MDPPSQQYHCNWTWMHSENVQSYLGEHEKIYRQSGYVLPASGVQDSETLFV